MVDFLAAAATATTATATATATATTRNSFYVVEEE
jgi:hypothetical protein